MNGEINLIRLRNTKFEGLSTFNSLNCKSIVRFIFFLEITDGDDWPDERLSKHPNNAGGTRPCK